MGLGEGVLGWQGFFTLLGEVAASFAGLLFVALALNRAEFRDPAKRHLLLLANQTFFNLLVLTAPSLVSLARGLGTNPKSFGITLAVACLGGLATCLHAIREERKVRPGKNPDRDYLRAYYFPGAIYSVMLPTAFRMMSPSGTEPRFVAAGAIMLLMVSARNAWTLLFLP